MSKSSTVTARIHPDVKRAAESIFRELGLTASQAITLFYRQVELRDGLPFEVRLPNEATREALRQAEARDGLTSFETADDLFADLGA